MLRNYSEDGGQLLYNSGGIECGKPVLGVCTWPDDHAGLTCRADTSGTNHGPIYIHGTNTLVPGLAVLSAILRIHRVRFVGPACTQGNMVGIREGRLKNSDRDRIICMHIQ